ncbi:hypothetical protein ACW9YV_16360 (plasmid) [Paraburkholderia strydomiana]
MENAYGRRFKPEQPVYFENACLKETKPVGIGNADKPTETEKGKPESLCQHRSDYPRRINLKICCHYYQINHARDFTRINSRCHIDVASNPVKSMNAINSITTHT